MKKYLLINIKIKLIKMVPKIMINHFGSVKAPSRTSPHKPSDNLNPGIVFRFGHQ